MKKLKPRRPGQLEIMEIGNSFNDVKLNVSKVPWFPDNEEIFLNDEVLEIAYAKKLNKWLTKAIAYLEAK